MVGGFRIVNIFPVNRISLKSHKIRDTEYCRGAKDGRFHVIPVFFDKNGLTFRKLKKNTKIECMNIYIYIYCFLLQITDEFTVRYRKTQLNLNFNRHLAFVPLLRAPFL